MTDHPVEQERTELELFKERVRDMAWDYAVKYGWCDEVQELLHKLGVPVTDPMVRATVSVLYEVRAFVPWDYLTDEPNKVEWLEQQLHVPSLITKGWLYKDKPNETGDDEMFFDPIRVRARNVSVYKPERKS